MSDDPGACQACGRDGPTASYAGSNGPARRLCGRCLDAAVERRSWEIERELIEARLRAMSRQQARLERENAALREMMGDGDTGTA